MTRLLTYFSARCFSLLPVACCSHLAPVQKYLRRSIRTINSNAETVKSYHCCLLPVACCLLSPANFQLGARSQCCLLPDELRR
ncbi:MAG: hypothetical protein F6K31_40305 [Symploca sp. SIO2G7]|nr:hypothetical protein [Symploca sp. SIO2G7]